MLAKKKNIVDAMSTYLIGSPRLGEGFMADVRSNGWHLRLVAVREIEGWTYSILDLGGKKYGLPQNQWASDAEDAKRRAEEYARDALGVIDVIDWIAP
jgi:hypothetical protein